MSEVTIAALVPRVLTLYVRSLAAGSQQPLLGLVILLSYSSEGIRQIVLSIAYCPRRRHYRVARVYSGVCLFVCLSVFLHDISRTDAARITKLDTDMVYHES